MTPAQQLAALSAEITNDPLGRGYAGMTDEQVAASLMVENRTVNRPHLAGFEITDAIVDAEWDALTANQKQQIMMLAAVQRIPASGFAAKIIQDAFAPGTQTRANILAARNQTVSRATELGLGRVRPGHVVAARTGA